jgi:hypothetical protein
MLNAHNVKNVSFFYNGKRGKFQNVVIIYATTLTVEMSKLLPRREMLRSPIIYVELTTHIPRIFSSFGM